jgi:hypothetical protein
MSFDRPNELIPSLLIVLNGLLTQLVGIYVDIRGFPVPVRLQGG